MTEKRSSTPPVKAGPLADAIREARLVWRLLIDARVPLWVKVVPLLTLVYLILPFDLLPDLVLGLGQLDDLAALFLGMQLFVLLAPPQVVEELRREILFGRSSPPGGSQTSASGPTIEASYRVVSAETPPEVRSAAAGTELPAEAGGKVDKTRE